METLPVDRLQPSKDPAFVARIQRRDPEALEAVVQAYLQQILRAARASGLNAQAAEDLTQDTFTTFLEKADTFEGRSHVRTWIFGILYRKIAEARRGRQREDRHDDIDELVEQRFREDGSWSRPPRPIDDVLHDEQIGEKIDECLELAPTQQRMAFVLKEVEQMNSEEICNILDVTRTNLGVLLYRARNRLRECLESKGVAR
jgi:RNA polymerase sigma-70 factor (ECF subfamily)